MKIVYRMMAVCVLMCLTLVFVQQLFMTNIDAQDVVEQSAVEDSDKATWSSTEVTLPAFSHKMRGMKKGGMGKMAMHNNGAWFPDRKANRENKGDVKVPIIRFDQGDFTVDIYPEQGSVVGRVQEKDGTDWFYYEERIKDWLPWWESGVKANFPFPEHGMRTTVPSAWSVVTTEDGALRYSSWMEFSRHNQLIDSIQFGRYTTMTLEQDVEVKAGDPRLKITYRMTNPTSYKQGLRVWNDAFYPRFHHPEGVVHGRTDLQFPDDAELFGGMDWASDHLARKFAAFDPSVQGPQVPSELAVSYFTWDVQEGWAGVYYPSVDVARLRLVDPVKAPGAKWWWQKAGHKTDVNHNFIELWGGTDHVFEGVERWLAPGESWEATWSFLYLKGIGKPVMANDQGVIGLRGDRIAAVSLDPIDNASLWVNGQKVAEGESASSKPLIHKASDITHVELRAGDRVLVSTKVPRERLPLREEVAQTIRDSNNRDIKESLEKLGNQTNHGKNYRNAHYASSTPGRARYHLREGELELALNHISQHLEKTPGDYDQWRLKAAILAEMGKTDEALLAVDRAMAGEAPAQGAAYMKAVLKLAKKETDTAKSLLSELIKQRPNHFEARLLYAYLSDDPRVIEQLIKERPANPRVLWVAMEKGVSVYGKDAKAAYERVLSQEPGAADRVALFQAVTRGVWKHPARLEWDGRR